MQRRTLSSIGLMLMLVCGLTACGYLYQTTTNAPGKTPVAASTASTSKASGAAPVAVTPGQVKLALDKTQYARDETVTVSILNGLQVNIYTTNHQSDCSILLLEWQGPGGWVTVGRCLSEIASGPVMLKAGSITALQFKPSAATFRTPPAGAWQPGSYRFTLFYHFSPEPDSVQGLHTQAVEFTVA